MKIWSWRAKDRAELPGAVRTRFGTTDDCKPVEGGGKILITSSDGGVALVKRLSGQVLFSASVVNAHSAEILPRGRVVVAASRGKGGDRLVLFNLRGSAQPLYTDELVSAHGVVWDKERKVLWALGEKELRAYRLQAWTSTTPSLSRSATIPLPDPDGHDLYPVPGTATLMVTTNQYTWLFDRDKHRFVPHPNPDLAGAWAVKSMAVHPVTKRLAYVKADTQGWAECVRFVNPEGVRYLRGERLYKARWVVTEAAGSKTPAASRSAYYLPTKMRISPSRLGRRGISASWRR